MLFDKNLYHKEYCKKNYIEKKVRIKPDFWLEIEDFCHWNNMSFNSLVISSIKKIFGRRKYHEHRKIEQN